MKQWIVLLLSVGLASGLIACGGQTDGAPPQTSPPPEPSASASAPAYNKGNPNETLCEKTGGSYEKDSYFSGARL